MRSLGLCFAILALAALPANANPGDVWILGIHHLDDAGAFTSHAGAGYDGPQSSGNPAFVGDAYGRNGAHGSARVYWELSGLSVNTGRPVPTTAELYTIEVYGTTEQGNNDWQPVESQFNGPGGETFPIEPNIPWAGQFGTNNQWIGSDGSDNGLFNPTGPGPQAPESADFNAGGSGHYMWLTSGSWLYAKWDFPWDINRTWSAIRLTQVTGIPEPGSALLLGIAVSALGLSTRRRRSA